MGNSVAQASGNQKISQEVALRLFSLPPSQLNNQAIQNFEPGGLSSFFIFSDNDPCKTLVQDKLKQTNGFPEKQSRGMAAVIGMVIGDALGAPLEFSPVNYQNRVLHDMNQTDVWENNDLNQFRLKPGQWTDDASMGLCLADSLLVNQEYNPIDLRLRFLRWWQLGYNNAFGFDSPKRNSVGLGGNISESLEDFIRNPSSPETLAGNSLTSGNGSLMRLAPVPVFYANNRELALDIARKQSKATHNGEEAAECCRLMTHIIISLIHASESSPQLRKEAVLSNLDSTFSTDCYGVSCLARSENEKSHPSNKQIALADRQWNWKQDIYHYSVARAAEQPTYIGSYAMDALSMALHCIWTTNSFTEAVLKVVNLQGDADTTGSITGQIAGSLYGLEGIPIEWINTIQQWDNNGRIALRAYLLSKHLGQSETRE